MGKFANKEIMSFNNIEEIKKSGFEGFKTVKSLWKNSASVPKKMGVYLVLNPEYRNPEFIIPGVGGFFKGKDPNVTLEELEKKHVEDSMVVYIGKAGGIDSSATLYFRISQYLKFGQGKNIGHYGGRYIWQLANYRDLIFCWKAITESPRIAEIELMAEFKQQFNAMPFANLTR